MEKDQRKHLLLGLPDQAFKKIQKYAGAEEKIVKALENYEGLKIIKLSKFEQKKFDSYNIHVGNSFDSVAQAKSVNLSGKGI